MRLIERSNERSRVIALRLLAVLALLCAAIFLPAWTLHYPRAWIFIAVYMACSTCTTVDLRRRAPDLLERRFAASPFQERDASERTVMLLVSAAFPILLAVSALDHRFAWSHVPSVAVVLGDLFVALGFAVQLLALRQNRFAAVTVETTSDQHVVSTGAYAVVRHPMYAGGFILLAGIPLALGSWFGLVVVAVTIPLVLLRIRHEEAILSERLPGYRSYCSAVRWRLVPGIF